MHFIEEIFDFFNDELVFSTKRHLQSRLPDHYRGGPSRCLKNRTYRICNTAVTVLGYPSLNIQMIFQVTTNPRSGPAHAEKFQKFMVQGYILTEKLTASDASSVGGNEEKRSPCTTPINASLRHARHIHNVSQTPRQNCSTCHCGNSCIPVRLFRIKER